MNIIPITPPRRSLQLKQSGEAAVCIVETLASGTEESVEVRGRDEAVAVIVALVFAFDLPALPESYSAIGRGKLATV